MIQTPISTCGYNSKELLSGVPAEEAPPVAMRRSTRGPSRFTQADVVKVLKAAQKAQFRIACVRIELDGAILIIPSTSELVPSSPTSNEWDLSDGHP